MNVTPAPCPLCARAARCASGEERHLVHEFRHSFLLVGDHQYHKGYCVLVHKQHVREIHNLPDEIQQAHFRELMASARAIEGAFTPWKLNFSCYGNQVPHIHWHIFPRYEDDPDRLHQPWFHSDEFARRTISPDQAAALAQVLRKHLSPV